MKPVLPCAEQSCLLRATDIMEASAPPARFPLKLFAWFVFLGAISITSVARASGDKDETYRERLEFDPATGQWVELPAPVPGTDAGDLAIARELLAKGEFAKARKVFELWFKTYPDSPHRPEALFYAADNEVAAEDEKPRGGDLIRAYEYLQELLQGWPGTELSDRALRKELIIAEMILFKGHKQKVWRGMFWLSATEEALHMLDRIIDDFAKGSAIAEQALRIKADYHYQAGEFEEAELAYARLQRDFPRGRYHKVALLRSGESALARFPGADFDEADLLEAEVYFQDFQQRFPQDSEPNGIPQKLLRIKESRAEKDYNVGRYYERVRQYSSAAFYYRQIEKNYPATTWAMQAHNRLVALGEITPPMPVIEEPASQPDQTAAADNND